jgi:hypothetical protein
MVSIFIVFQYKKSKGQQAGWQAPDQTLQLSIGGFPPCMRSKARPVEIPLANKN